MSENSLIKKIKITRIVQETERAKTFFLEPQDDWKPKYEAGQFITLVFYTKHGEKRRSYSLSSSPFENELSITVKKIENGEFSRLLNQHAKVGDLLYTSGISGHFRLPENHKDKHFVFIAAGSGIVPCYSLIKTLLHSGENKVTLIYSNKNEPDSIFYRSLKQLQEDFQEKFQIHFLFGDSDSVYNKRLSKWLLEQLLHKYVNTDFGNTLFYICGPFDYMLTVEITLRVFTAKENIIKENFSSLPRLTIPKPPDTEAHKATIHLNGKTYKFEVQYPKSILTAAIENKIEVPYSCRAGRCSSCIATCSKGKVWLAYNEVLTDKEIENGKILTCQGFPIGGDVEIRY